MLHLFPVVYLTLMSDIKQNKPIRVLQVLHVLNRGGAEAMVMNLYRRIDRTRVQFDFLVHSQKPGLFEEEIKAMGGRIFRVHAFKGFNLISYYRECLNFFKTHSEIKVVHGHLGSCAAYYLHAAKKSGIFTIAHSHSAGSLKNFFDLSYKIFSYPTRWIADQLFGCSTEAGIARYGIRAAKSNRYKNFNNAVDTSLFHFNKDKRQALRKEFNINNTTLMIGTVGRVTRQKNPLRIYSIFKEIIRQNPNVICLWVGTGEMENQIKDMITNDGVEDKIIMTGIRSDIPAIMSALDCMIFPSLWEGLPVSVIESQMANLPCVLSTNISRETEISDLLSWRSLSDSDTDWAADAISLAINHRDRREHYFFLPETSGYDIDNTVIILTKFYEDHAK